MGDLARAAKVTQGTMSVMVKKLVNKGLVERAENPQDLRVVKVRLTQKGRDAYRQHTAIPGIWMRLPRPSRDGRSLWPTSGSPSSTRRRP